MREEARYLPQELSVHILTVLPMLPEVSREVVLRKK